MSLATVYSRAQLGITSPSVTVEVHLSGGLPGMAMVGLPETAVKESKERVRSALIHAGFDFPQRRITVNLAPADLPKEGGRYDLAIALGILQASGQLKSQTLDQHEIVAELALSGEIRPIRGALPVSLACGKAGRTLILPAHNADEATLLGDTPVIAATHLLDVCRYLSGKAEASFHQPDRTQIKPITSPDLADVKGQFQARRALEVAAAGQLNLLFSGPPGSGKSLLAACLPGILPELTLAERLEVASVHSLVGLPVHACCQGQRPFRAVHHTASAVALVGGGANHPRPGEISLATQGVLFLDEMPEFPRRVLDLMREPMETGKILISRALSKVEYPAAFQLVSAMNPCPCGHYQDGTDRCICTPDQIRRYQGRVSGPLLDRIDLQLWVSALSADTLLQPTEPAESSITVRQRVAAARARQEHRQGYSNRYLQGRDLETYCQLTPDTRTILLRAMERLHLSARGCHRVLRVARTLADLDAVEPIQKTHLLEALAFRGMASKRDHSEAL
ncbi:YifB family Mg chelatase-like AAA ATPase [Nitrincola schmidtii]|uniref:YifB family Mg chelatase-like AAA ATPase n=1 Tax=Nitrincola schmidtii TaxID=1730894 RepID=UPI00124CFC78|nr:YifB family Mg chelatase-like AAA ATPase [Nitrincola schmidtii]